MVMGRAGPYPIDAVTSLAYFHSLLQKLNEKGVWKGWQSHYSLTRRIAKYFI